ncbi:sideroflexin-2 isoform X2 [Peromyscus californicus insignis]|uniref:sideroflexin-2 isoform X2 n=1 Tax=Peromyscus californicus insignis TaxID=564181 RepID=UPI0022A775B4|nr:sideroflexin-2 isoform X2 [Peromyscus californicus insignis]
MEADLSGFNIDAPRWDQCTFLGRVKHFFNITDPRTVFASEQELDWAKVMVEKSRMGLVPPGTQVEQLLYAKKLYDSAFHPDTGEKMNVIGRMSFQVPGGMIITGFMLQFYRTIPAVIFWQWVNQSFNALVNYTNRNAASPTSVRQMALSYFTATTTAVATAVGMNMWTKRAPPLVGRWVPFAAVAAANCVNIPMMRQQELIQGICVKDRDQNELGCSQRAAAVGITQVVVSRITMAAPGMILLPVIMERLERLRAMKPPLHGASGMWALPSGMQISSFLSRTRAAGHHQGQVWRTRPLCLLQQGSLSVPCLQGPIRTLYGPAVRWQLSTFLFEISVHRGQRRVSDPLGLELPL